MSKDNSDSLTMRLCLPELAMDVAIHLEGEDLSAASLVLCLPELAMNVAIHLEGENLFKAFPITRPLQPLFHSKAFWLKKLEQHGLANLTNFEMEVSELRHIYQHCFRTIEAIKIGKAPLRYSSNIVEHTRDIIIWCLYFESIKTQVSRTFTTFEDLVHKRQSGFWPESIFACGRFCMGWENSGRTKVIRKVDDWSVIVDRLPTTPMAKEWIPNGFICSKICCMFDGRVLPERLEKKLSDAQYWIAFFRWCARGRHINTHWAYRAARLSI